jgi:hypothetical protein
MSQQVTPHLSKIIAIVWAPQEARTAMFAKRLNAALFNVHYLQYKRPLVAPIKYVAQWLKTWLILVQQRPRFVYITNPPVFAALCVAMYCAVTRTQYIMDTHSPALYSRKWGWTVPLQRFLSRFALINIVDQARFQDLFKSWGAKAIVLATSPKDAPPDLKGEVDQQYFDIAVVNTFAADEPLDIILEAARCLPQTVRFFIMGDLKQANPGMVKSAPPNAIFTDYLWREAYWNRLYTARAVLALTTYPHSLLRGAHDGLMLAKPLIISRQPALIEYFSKGAIYVDHTADSIVAAVQQAQEQEQQIKQQLRELAVELTDRWETNFEKLTAVIRAAEEPAR